jgi:hypothetical protein
MGGLERGTESLKSKCGLLDDWMVMKEECLWIFF